MRVVTAVSLSLAALGLTAATPCDAVVAYRVTPEVVDGSLKALQVEISFRGGASGHTTLDLPDVGMGQKDRWRYLSDLRVDGASIKEEGPAKRILDSEPNAPIVVSYRVLSAYTSDPKGSDGNPYIGAAILPTWFTTLGDFVFATPEGRDHAPATFKWGTEPKGWTLASDLDAPELEGHLEVADVTNSTLLGGKDVHLYSRPISSGMVRIAIRGEWKFPESTLVDDIPEVIGAQRRFWGKSTGPYFVSVIPLATSASVISVGGTGRFKGFALYGTSNADETMLRRIVAHEHIHNWIPQQQGKMPDGLQEPRDYWYSEGLTDFYTDRTLLRSGLWTVADFIQHLNVVLREYDTSPVRTAPTDRIVSDFWKNSDVQKLAYERGYLLALIWDQQMRQTSQGAADLDQVMLAMRDRASETPRDMPYVVANFEREAKERTGVDVAPAVERFATRGEAINLPKDIFGDCASVVTATVPAFDLGFDGAASAAKGVFTGVEPSGSAYKAGLRDGMKRIAREGGEPGDSRVEITYRVMDQNGEEYTIRYKPEGRTTVSFQQIVFMPKAPADTKACAARLNGRITSQHAR